MCMISTSPRTDSGSVSRCPVFFQALGHSRGVDQLLAFCTFSFVGHWILIVFFMWFLTYGSKLFLHSESLSNDQIWIFLAPVDVEERVRLVGAFSEGVAILSI